MATTSYAIIPLNLSKINMTGVEFSVEEAISILEPLVMLVAGIFLYAWFIFKFYRFLAKKDIFGLNLKQYNEATGFFKKIGDGLFYIVEYLLIFPIFVFFWFIVLSFFIAVISTRPFLHILLASMGLVAAIRISAYYNEELSKDLAKMIPFALLGIFLIDIRLLTIPDIIQIFWQIILNWKNIIYYLVLTIAVEILLRMVSKIVELFKR